MYYFRTEHGLTKAGKMQILHSKISGDGKPLLILHGFLGSGDNWMSLGRRWAEEFQVHLLDLRNHGRSFHDDEMSYEVMIEDIAHYTEHYGIGRFSLLGHSMGGKLAMHWAVSHPGTLDKLVIADIAPKAYPRNHDRILKALEQVDFERHTTRQEVERVLSRYIDRADIRLFLMKNIKRTKNGGLAFKCNLPVLAASYASITEALPAYSIYEGETLFLRGGLSPYIEKEDEALIYAHFPAARIVEIPGAGHWLHAERPEIFYREVRNFLSGETAVIPS